MKNLLSTICLIAILLIAGCDSELESTRNKNIRLWVSSDVSTNIRGGYLVDPNRVTEIGIETVWWDCNEEPRTIGIYALRHLPDIIQMQPPFGGWPELAGHAYYGAKIFRDLELGESGFAPISGIRVPPFFFEYKFDSMEPSLFTLGIQYDF